MAGYVTYRLMNDTDVFNPDAGIPQVLSGGGGGPEMAGAVEKVAGTKFAFEGGGFVWFRFDGTALHISFRDSTGKLLYAHKLTKP